MGVALGLLATLVLLVFVIINKAVSAMLAMIPSSIVVGLVGGALVGLIAYALPLTATSGSSQLAVELQSASTMGTGFIAAILIAKMVAVALSLSSGFLDGNVFPIIFIGGTAGVLIHSLFPAIPMALAVGAMLAAVPGAFLGAPISLILIAAGTVRIGSEALMSVGIAVVTAHLLMAFIRSCIQGD